MVSLGGSLGGSNLSAPRAAENPYAGQGPVLLDVGDDIGALVVNTPAEMEGVEVQLRPAGTTAGAQAHQRDHPHENHPQGDHKHGPGPHDHDGHVHYPHVGVVARPVRDRLVYSLVYPGVTQGEYELFVLPDGPVAMRVTAVGGTVSILDWPR
ncbi:MAG TPA: hypothetical protein VFJ97_01765 [Dermatophilaceae bacterium]|nr:hypothetical protein [Dermatophilaceae bacterium]